MLNGGGYWGQSGSTRKATARILAHAQDTARCCSIHLCLEQGQPFGCYLPLKNEQRSQQRVLLVMPPVSCWFVCVREAMPCLGGDAVPGR